MTYKPTGYSLEIFKDRYALTSDETWEKCCERVANQVILVEKPEKRQYYFDKFNEILINNLFVPGGRIWRGAGRHQPNLLNCFVGIRDIDSKQGWGSIINNLIITSMSGGGIGNDLSDVRPMNADVGSNGGICPGPMSLARLMDAMAPEIRAGGGRRIAMMIALILNHPDIIRFIDSKSKSGELTNANLSVKCLNTKEFINAVRNNLDWELSWKGRYKSKISARELWDKIVYNNYHFAEPGFLNWELVESENTISYITELLCTNPCGEQPMSQDESCDLGHLVLTRYVENGQVNWNEMANTIRLGVRLLDNVLDVNYYPLIEQKEVAHKLRRIGLGTTGLGDMMVLLNLRYGSISANKFKDRLYHFIAKVAYESSVMLSIEKGMFPLCNPKKHTQTGFVSRMPNKIKALIEEVGIRNCALLTAAPVGTGSILSGNITSGIEPMFAPAYERRYWLGNERKVELVFHPLFKQFVEEKKNTDNFVSGRDLSVREHLEVQKIIQKHIDNAVSKTILIPEDYPIEEMSKTWLEYLPYIKGTTFYRENTRGYVDSNGNLQEPPLKAIPIEEAKERLNEGSADSGIEQRCKSGVCEL